MISAIHDAAHPCAHRLDPGAHAEDGRPRRRAGIICEPARGHYRRLYTLSGGPREILVQQVWVEVGFHGAGAPLVVLRATYGEYFRLDEQGHAEDRHDFDVRHQGWTRGSLARLLRRHRERGVLCDATGPYTIEVCKRYALGRGAVEDVVPLRRTAPGVMEFGLLDSGPLERANSTMTLAGPRDEPLLLSDTEPFVAFQRRAGHGRFTGERGWIAEERLHYAYGARAGTLVDGDGYLPTGKLSQAVSALTGGSPAVSPTVHREKTKSP